MLGKSFDPIAGHGDVGRVGSNPNADALRGRLHFADLIAQNFDRLGLPLDIDPDAAVLADSQNLVLLDDVSMPLKRRRSI